MRQESRRPDRPHQPERAVRQLDDAAWQALAEAAAVKLPPMPDFSHVPALATVREELPAAVEVAMEETPAQAVQREKLHPRQLPKTTRYKNITRVDHKRTHGYFVRVAWQGERKSKFFSDRKLGDRLAALSAAVAWRDEMEKELGKPRSERQVVGISRTGKEVTGVRKRLKGNCPVYEVHWVEDGKVRRTSFSIRKYGERTAKSMAVKLRRQKERARLLEPRD